MEERNPTAFGVFPVLTYCAARRGYVPQLLTPTLAHWVFYGQENTVLPDAVFDKEMRSFTLLVFLQKEAAPSLARSHPGDSDVLAD